MLARTLPGVVEAAMLFRQIQDAVFRANEVLQNFVALFKESEPEYQAIHINSLILETIILVRKELTDHDIAVVTKLEQPLPTVAGHKGQLREVLLNLLQNSIEAMVTTIDARIIRIATGRRDPNSIIISIHDTGPGIGPERLTSIFDPFITTKSGGTGLGLAICKMIVEQHGGKILATSDPMGGARFEITLPIAKSSLSVSPLISGGASGDRLVG
jgi:signal transduction histidine kinase